MEGKQMEHPMIEEINAAYRRLSEATDESARAERALADHERRVRVDNADVLLDAKNERATRLYLDGLLDTEEHRRLEDARMRADLELQHARREVERLHLVVRLISASV